MAQPTSTSEEIRRSRELAEASREVEWKGKGFLRDLFLGRFRLELVHPYPLPGAQRPEFKEWMDAFERLLRERVDSRRLDELGEYPADLLDGLRELGAFGMNIPAQYGGLGFSHAEYGTAMKLLGSVDGSVTALLSAHQSIGVPRPVELFGSEELKRKYLPRCAEGAISAFALTETTVGSDPARLSTIAEPTEDGRFFLLNGAKLWTTNGGLAELLVVIARNPKTDALSAFVVETGWPGVEVTQRLHFMGLHAISNVALRFTDVKVPRENLIGKEGRGLKIALTTLNTGRLSLPAATAGGAKILLELCRKWANARAQWGQEIGKHEAIAHKLADLAATAFAMEAVSDLGQALADRKGYDIRLEAAAAKEWNTTAAWRLVDEAMQIRGGRGYESAASLESRGEAPVPVEQWMRDARIDLIFEGSSEIMHLFIAREAVDKHLQIAGKLIDPKVSTGEKLRALPRIAAFYAVWYAGLWLRGAFPARYRSFGRLARHLRFIERKSRKLAREIFHAMVAFGAGTERRQAFLFRVVDVTGELFAMAASALRADAIRRAGLPEAPKAEALAEQFCAGARRKVQRLFHELWSNDDRSAYRTGRAVLAGKHAWLEKGGVGLGLTIEDLRPKVAPRRPEPRPEELTGFGAAPEE